MRLSIRMHMVADLVTKGERLADIGCDHGYLSVWLVREGRVGGAIAMDLREGPLGRAKENIQFFHQQNTIETRLSDGMNLLMPGEADRIVIAGMGGILMANILQRGSECCKQCGQMVLQPQSDCELVRKKVHELGFRIDAERICFEDGKYYIAFSAVKGMEEIPYTEMEYRYGRILLKAGDALFMEYMKEELRKREEMLARLRNAGTEATENRILLLLEEMKQMKEFNGKE